LQWFVGGVSHWSIEWVADVWHNVAYEIDFSGGKVSFYHSTGSNALTLTAGPVTAAASSNGEDWHLGVLELPVSGQADTNEDFYFSGTYIESGSLTTSVAGPGGVVVSSAASSTLATHTSSVVVSSTAPTTSAPGGTLSKWSQCGGIGWTGSGTCVTGTTCTYSTAYYSQCL